MRKLFLAIFFLLPSICWAQDVAPEETAPSKIPPLKLTTKSGKKVNASSNEAQVAPLIKLLNISFGSHAFERTNSLGDFTPNGPVLSTLIPVDNELQGIALDHKTNKYYGVTMHKIGELDKGSGKLVQFASVPKISWPKGIAFDERERRLWVSSADGSGGYLNSLDVDSGQWLPGLHLGQLSFLALAYCAEDGLLYGLPEPLGSSRLGELVRITPKGAVVDKVKFSESIILFSDPGAVVQMTASSNAVYLFMSTYNPHPRVQRYRLYRIQIGDGSIVQMPYGGGINLVEKLWPGMPEGPGPSVDIPGCCTEGHSSNYRTPNAILADQAEDFHIVSVRRGDVTSMDMVLQHLKSVEIDSQKVNVVIDFGSKPSMVEVSVEPSEKPIVLGLAALEAVVWKIEPKNGSRLLRVILLGTKDQAVTGIDKNTEMVNRATGDLFSRNPIVSASAWELPENEHADFDTMIVAFRKIAGLRESSFQGCIAGKKFSVPFPGADEER